MAKGPHYSEVPGRLVRLDDVRVVFVGDHPTMPDRKLVGMRNEEGKDTLFALSYEAASALGALLSGEPAGEAGTMPEPPKKPGWHHVSSHLWEYAWTEATPEPENKS